MTGLRYVYAVCRPFGTPLQAQLTGVAGAPPRLLGHHGLVAVVSTVPEADFAEGPLRDHLTDLDWLTATARAHQGVIDALTTVTTPVPLRLATVFHDDSGVRMMIEAREDSFRRTLDRLTGRVEWSVKVYAESGPSAERQAREFADRLHATLSAHAEDSRLHAPHDTVLNAAYLVPRADCEEFVEIVGRAKGDAAESASGVRVKLTGPWAAYSFAGDFVVGDLIREVS